MNTYLKFISDDDFEECVEHVLNGYPIKRKKQEKSRQQNVVEMLKKDKNTIDEFKLLFDMFGDKYSLNEWKNAEIIRQTDKTINNYVGEFHQKVLGHVDGWIDLGIGDESKVDLKKEDNTIFIELKNKYNTTNSSSLEKLRDKLENLIEIYPNSTAYWGFIISKNYKPICEIWTFKNRPTDERILKASGTEIYKLVTGDPCGLKKTFESLQIVLNEKVKDYNLSNEDKKYLQEFSNHVFLESR
ncbi:MAG: Eco47II family restriction endonuclease [Methanobrevibacter sp.]|jgi:hypothetical protein|nr:Eco47II family restriction endonuclease [Candidatus Methanoflexus mossambicus]